MLGIQNVWISNGVVNPNHSCKLVFKRWDEQRAKYSRIQQFDLNEGTFTNANPFTFLCFKLYNYALIFK